MTTQPYLPPERGADRPDHQPRTEYTIRVELTTLAQAWKQDPSRRLTRAKVADVAIHHHAGPYAGLQLTGWTVHVRTHPRTGRLDWDAADVRPPARTYHAAGSERWTFAQLRPQDAADLRAHARLAGLCAEIQAATRSRMEGP